MMKKKPSRTRFNWRWYWPRLRAWLLEDRPGAGLGGPPNNWQSAKIVPTRTSGDTGVEYTYIGFRNDAFEIWIGKKYNDSADTWMGFVSAPTFRRMAIWYLWRWAWGEWFGLRRKLFYWDLNRRVRSWKLEKPTPSQPEPRP